MRVFIYHLLLQKSGKSGFKFACVKRKRREDRIIDGDVTTEFDAF